MRAGTTRAVLRGEFANSDRRLLVEVEVRSAGGRSRAQLNRQPLRRASDLAEQVPVLTFQPDDLLVVKGPPSARRQAIDGAIISLKPSLVAERRRLDSCLRQRNALLRQIGPSRAQGLDADSQRTLEVWDDRLAAVAESWATNRRQTLQQLQPRLERLFCNLSGDDQAVVELTYEPEWLTSGLRSALAEARKEDLQRATTSVGPHRDDFDWRLGQLPARTHASQGNQRTLSLAFRLALHAAMTEANGEPPLLLLDDVFSELDLQRQGRLLKLLPPGQILLATAGEIPPVDRPAQVLWIEDLQVTASDLL